MTPLPTSVRSGATAMSPAMFRFSILPVAHSSMSGPNIITSQRNMVGKLFSLFRRLVIDCLGLRIMSFGVLYDFTGNSNVSKVIPAKTLVAEDWFLDAIDFKEPIDLFLLIGHNPVRRTDSSSTFGLLHDTIRSKRPEVPIQVFGGHSHIRDFTVYDDMSTGLESGRYCETLGWLSMSGINSSTFTGNDCPRGVPNPTRKATNTSTSDLVYSRKYLDWNRLTFEYHATDSQASTFDYHSGLNVTGKITDIRTELNLSSLYGCAPATYCAYCQPFGTPGNIFSLVETALGATVVNTTRATVPRYIIMNTGSIRFDLVEGPFTYDDSFIVSPFTDGFQYIPNVPYAQAQKVLAALNNATLPDKRSFGYMPLDVKDSCLDPTIGLLSASTPALKTRGITRRQSVVTPGYTTTDDFGTDGDDTPHSMIPDYDQPEYCQGNASFPTDGSTPEAVDVIFLDYFATSVVQVLNGLGNNVTIAEVTYYLPDTFTTNSYLPVYAKMTPAWQADVPNCPAGKGVGFSR